MERIYWNRDWQFITEFTEELLNETNDSNKAWNNSETVCLPHTTKITGAHYFDENEYQMDCAYKREIEAPTEWEGKHVLMTVEAAGHCAWVYLNGVLLASHFCGYTAFTVDLKDHLKLGEKNKLVIWVNSSEKQNVPPFGKVIDYMTFGGLYREVYVEIKNEEYIKDVFAITKRHHSGEYSLTAQTELNIPENSEKELTVRRRLLDSQGQLVKAFDDNQDTALIEGIKEWNLNNPALYTLESSLYENDNCLDRVETIVGFREAEFRADGFYLNKEKIKIRGLNRHQSYPYVGYAMPKSMQEFDAEILKNELGVNAVRTSHYPQSHHFLRKCDELGLLVFTEIPGWQHIGDAEWKEQAVENTREMVLQYRNHPSIILWGVRINESQDDDEFYARTNEMAHSLDPSRQTSGVRFIQKSHLLEDVYAFNDFSHEGSNKGCLEKKATTPDMGKGFFISEYNGHMYPTKAFDAEDHRVEHMLRHARVMNSYYGQQDIAGGFGWCMFDYNTHKDFGSGDRVCYHGVMDMFRNPKLAAGVFMSQQEDRDFLEISSNMDVGEHPACLMKDVYALTNADSVKFYKNGHFIGEFFGKNSQFSNMPHGPILIDDLIGDYMKEQEGFDQKKADEIKKLLMAAGKYGTANLPLSAKLIAAKCIAFRGMKMEDAVELYNKYIGNWGGEATEYKFEAIKNGQLVKTVIKSPMKKGHLEVKCSSTELHEADSYDVAAIRIRAISDTGNLLDFSNDPIVLKAEGCIEIIGPAVTGLNGGMGGTYVRTTGQEGQGKLIISSEAFGEEIVEFNVRKVE